MSIEEYIDLVVNLPELIYEARGIFRKFKVPMNEWFIYVIFSFAPEYGIKLGLNPDVLKQLNKMILASLSDVLERPE